MGMAFNLLLSRVLYEPVHVFLQQIELSSFISILLLCQAAVVDSFLK